MMLDNERLKQSLRDRFAHQLVGDKLKITVSTSTMKIRASGSQTTEISLFEEIDGKVERVKLDPAEAYIGWFKVARDAFILGVDIPNMPEAVKEYLGRFVV